MPMVPKRQDRFRILDSPELGRVLLNKALQKPFDPLSPNEMLSRYFHAESGQERPSLTSGPPLTVRDRAKDTVTDLLGGNRDLANRLVTGAEFVVPPIGAAFGAYDFGRSVASGDIPGSLGAMIGITPGRVFSKIGARVKPDIEPRQMLPDGSMFERQTFTSNIGVSKVQTIVDVKEVPVRTSRHGATELGPPIATIMFRRELPNGVKLSDLPPREGVQALLSVQNNFADFVLPKLSEGKPFRVRFGAASKELEEFYKEIMPRLETAYGVKVRRGPFHTEDGLTNGFILDFPAGHKLPVPKK